MGKIKEIIDLNCGGNACLASTIARVVVVEARRGISIITIVFQNADKAGTIIVLRIVAAAIETPYIGGTKKEQQSHAYDGNNIRIETFHGSNLLAAACEIT